MSYFDTIFMVPLEPGVASNGRRFAPNFGGDTSHPRPLRKGVVDVVTFDELFQFCLVLIGVISLVIQIVKKK